MGDLWEYAAPTLLSVLLLLLGLALGVLIVAATVALAG